MSIFSNLWNLVTGKSVINDLIHSLLADGGLQGLMNKLNLKGLGEIFASWVGTGKNLSITPNQLWDALGARRVLDLAQKFGLPVQTVLDWLAQYLPSHVDSLTPEGKLPDGSIPVQIQPPY